MTFGKHLPGIFGNKGLIKAAAVLAVITGIGYSSAWAEEDLAAAGKRVAVMFHAARVVISRNQDLINSSGALTADDVLDQAKEVYADLVQSPYEPAAPGSSQEKFENMLLEAIQETMNEAQATLQDGSMGFKGFVPATFGHRVADKMKASSSGEIRIRQTNTKVRNRKNRPDDWEKAVFKEVPKSDASGTPRVYRENYREAGKQITRFMMPEYYEPSCLACHGGVAGERDITGNKREGKAAGELAGAVSVTIAQ